MTIKAARFFRVSSKEQEDGYSLEAQGRESTDYERRHDLETVRTWAVAESAKKADVRKAFKEFVQYFRTNPSVKVMLFEKPDRMTRNFRDLVTIYELIDEHHKEVHFFKTGLVINENSKSSDQLQLDLHVVLARNYINNLAEEVTKGLNEKLRGGGWPSAAPTGYLNDPVTRETVPDPARSKIVRKLFELYATGRYSLNQIAKIAQKEGLEHPHKKTPVKKSGIYHILTNPFYFGVMKWKDELVAGHHEPLLSKVLYDRVQSVLGGQQRPKTKKFAFRGFGECGHCGSPITAELHVKKQKNGVTRRYVYYRCTGWKNGGKVCEGSHISERDLVAQLGEPLKRLKIDAATLALVKSALAESFKGEKLYHAERMTALTAESTRLMTWIDKAYTDRLEGILTPEDFKAKSEGWRLRLMDVQGEIRAHQEADGSYLEDATLILDIAQRAYAIYEVAADNFERRRIVDQLVSKVVISDRRAVLNLWEPYSVLSKVAVAAKSRKSSSLKWAVEDLNL